MILLKLCQPASPLHHCLKCAHCPHLFILSQLTLCLQDHLGHLIVPKHHLWLLFQRIFQPLLPHNLRFSYWLPNSLDRWPFFKSQQNLSLWSFVQLKLGLSLLLHLISDLVMIVEFCLSFSGVSGGLWLVLLSLQNILVLELPLSDLGLVGLLLVPLQQCLL